MEDLLQDISALKESNRNFSIDISNPKLVVILLGEDNWVKILSNHQSIRFRNTNKSILNKKQKAHPEISGWAF